MRICYFGTYEKDYPRNRIIIKGLKKNNIDVIECHAPLWELTRDKTGSFLGFFSLARLFFRLIFSYLQLILKFFKTAQTDIIIIGYIGQLDVLFLKLITAFRNKIVIFNPLISLYGTLVEDRKTSSENSLKAAALRFLDRLSFNLSNIILLDTDEHIKYFQNEFSINGDKFIKVFVGADEDVFCPGNYSEPTPPREEFRALFYGKYIPLHGISTIVESAKLLEAQKDIKFTLIGSGQLYPEIRRLAKNMNSNNIDFIEWVSYEELPRYIKDCDICLGIFSDNKKAGMVISNKVYQALAMGKPLITGDTAAAREILTHGVNAMLCRVGDPQALADCILNLKNNTELRKQVSTNGYRLFEEKYNSKAVCRPLADYLRNINTC